MTVGYGRLGEDACGECGGRVLTADLTRRVLLDEAKLDPRIIQELARESAGKQLPCPSCAAAMSPVTLKGTAVDICFACGVTFLDAGELERVSGGRHVEHAPPPTRVRPVDQLPISDDEPAPDPRATWEKAVPLYIAEAWLLWLVLVTRQLTTGPLTALGVALGVITLPLGLSMLVDVDLRSLFIRRHGWHFGGHRSHGVGGELLFVVAIFVGGLVSTLNAFVAERFPRLFSTTNALVALALLVITSLVLQVISG